jgi:Aminotransferase class-V
MAISSTPSYSARMSLGWYDTSRVYYYYYYYSTHGFIAGVLTTVASWAAWQLLTRAECWSSVRRLLHKDETTTTSRNFSTSIDNTMDKGDGSDGLIYLDYNGTTPVYPAIRDAMLPYFSEHFGNPGSAHALGDVPKRAVATARRQILTHLLGCHDIEYNSNDDQFARSAIVFTACGTESDNLIIHWALSHAVSCSTLQASLPSKTPPLLPHIVTSNVEHPAVDACLAAHERDGSCTVTRVPVQRNGRVLVNDVIAAIQKPHTCVLTILESCVVLRGVILFHVWMERMRCEKRSRSCFAVLLLYAV